jgi:hypothetical protein
VHERKINQQCLIFQFCKEKKKNKSFVFSFFESKKQIAFVHTKNETLTSLVRTRLMKNSYSLLADFLRLIREGGANWLGEIAPYSNENGMPSIKSMPSAKFL